LPGFYFLLLKIKTMKAIIKRIKNIEGDTYFNVFKDGDFLPTEAFTFKGVDEEKIAYEKAIKLAKMIEDDISEETIVYETGIQPIDFFVAANMDEDESFDFFKNIQK
jgi:hypothetical protein